jgi:hypothetical protein
MFSHPPYPSLLLITSSEGRWAHLTRNLPCDHCRRITPWADKPTTYGLGGVDSHFPARLTRAVFSTSHLPSFRRTASGVAGGTREILLTDTLASPSAQISASVAGTLLGRSLGGRLPPRGGQLPFRERPYRSHTLRRGDVFLVGGAAKWSRVRACRLR